MRKLAEGRVTVGVALLVTSRHNYVHSHRVRLMRKLNREDT